MGAGPCLDLEDLRFSWPGQAPLLEIRRFDLGMGEKLFLRGPSGSGKSTLLGLIAGVLAPQAGRVTVLGQDQARARSSQRDRLRADRLGVIFQMFNLVPYISVLQNVALPCRFSAARARRVAAAGGVEAEARRLLVQLGLDDPLLLSRPVTTLSVGQQQRVAAARALIGGPSLIIADEPTSALDADSRDRFIALLKAEVETRGAALLFVSHDPALSGHFDRSIDLGSLNLAARAEGAV